MPVSAFRDRLPLTIEIVGFEGGRPGVLDRVIGGSVYLEEAKRIGQRLLSVVDAGKRPKSLLRPQPRS
jgi:hypothetical protein